MFKFVFLWFSTIPQLQALGKKQTNESSFSKAPGAAQAWAKFSNKGDATSMNDLSSLKVILTCSLEAVDMKSI